MKSRNRLTAALHIPGYLAGLILDCFPHCFSSALHHCTYRPTLAAKTQTIKASIHIAPNQPHPTRLQQYAVGIFPRIPTKSALKKALKKGWITVNGNPATSATYIHGGESIKLFIPEAVRTGKKPDFKLEVLFEDDHLAIVHKPAGILVSGNRCKTIANALPQNIEPSAQPDAIRPQPVHRLDYATTGVLLAGKTSSSIRALNELFSDKEIEKTYYAITLGEQQVRGTIDAEIDGKQSLTHFEVCAAVPSQRFTRLNLVKLNPRTGRRHQLRKHLSGIGNPILGDRDYGAEGLILMGKGLYLHAYSLEFRHPVTGGKVFVAADLPRRFGKIFP